MNARDTRKGRRANAVRPRRKDSRARAPASRSWLDRALATSIVALVIGSAVWLLASTLPAAPPPGALPAVDPVAVATTVPKAPGAEAGSGGNADTAPAPPVAGGTDSLSESGTELAAPDLPAITGATVTRPARARASNAEAELGTPAREEGGPAVSPALHDAIVRENRELAAEVAALEAETMALEREMLELDLRVAALDAVAAESEALASELADAPATAESSPAPEPMELGNTTLVPAPVGVEISRADAIAGRSASREIDESFLPNGDIADVEDVRDLTVSEPSDGVDRYASDAYAEDPYGDADTDPWFDGDSAGVDPYYAESSAGQGGASRGSGRARASASTSQPIERLVISEVVAGSAAEAAGFTPGDVLLGIDGLPVLDFDDVLGHNVGEPAPLHDVEVLRGEDRRRLTLAGSPVLLSVEVRWVDATRLVE